MVGRTPRPHARVPGWSAVRLTPALGSPGAWLGPPRDNGPGRCGMTEGGGSGRRHARVLFEYNQSQPIASANPP